MSKHFLSQARFAEAVRSRRFQYNVTCSQQRFTLPLGERRHGSPPSQLMGSASYSRFFREAFDQEFYFRKLAKHGVNVVSITQPVGDESEPVHAMMRKVIALFDEYQSKENAKHVIRSMKENARQGVGFIR